MWTACSKCVNKMLNMQISTNVPVVLVRRMDIGLVTMGSISIHATVPMDSWDSNVRQVFLIHLIHGPMCVFCLKLQRIYSELSSCSTMGMFAFVRCLSRCQPAYIKEETLESGNLFSGSGRWLYKILHHIIDTAVDFPLLQYLKLVSWE